MNRNVIFSAMAALLLPSVAHAHPMATGAVAGVLHWLTAPDHVAVLAVAVVALLALAARDAAGGGLRDEVRPPPSRRVR